VADEAQTAFGRTGYWFGIEHFGIVPDIIATAKALGGGLPIGAVTASAALLSKVHVGGLGSTFGGNPIACAASLTVLDEISSKGLVDRAARVGGEIRQKLLTVQRELPLIGDVRGLGAMFAIELIRGSLKHPAGEQTERIVRRCQESGLIVLKAGTYNNVFRLAPAALN
jgi:4-aminobutyrate aminotransferase/(S)-3-amino-2-methylpropionate transaminase